MKNQTNKKNRLSLEVFDNWLGVILNGFFLVFFCLYIGKYGISNLILQGDNPWKMILNIGILYVIVRFLSNGLFDNLNNLKTRRLKWDL